MRIHFLVLAAHQLALSVDSWPSTPRLLGNTARQQPAHTTFAFPYMCTDCTRDCWEWSKFPNFDHSNRDVWVWGMLEVCKRVASDIRSGSGFQWLSRILHHLAFHNVAKEIILKSIQSISINRRTFNLPTFWKNANPLPVLTMKLWQRAT